MLCFPASAVKSVVSQSSCCLKGGVGGGRELRRRDNHLSVQSSVICSDSVLSGSPGPALNEFGSAGRSSPPNKPPTDSKENIWNKEKLFSLSLSLSDGLFSSSFVAVLWFLFYSLSALQSLQLSSLSFDSSLRQSLSHLFFFSLFDYISPFSSSPTLSCDSSVLPPFISSPLLL